jgi:3-hydroxyisobutyrate dehydrogenase
MRYGFIGLGNLGGHLAASLLRGDFEVTVHDTDLRAGERHLAAGARWAATPAEAALGVDALVTCLPSPAVSEAVLAQVLPDLRGRDWIEMSTLGRTEILRLAEIAEALGVRCLECPVTGGVHLAKSGQITVLAGGGTDLFERHLPALQAMGDRIQHMGPLGSAAVIKVITNMLAFIHLVADGEALMLAKRTGVPGPPRLGCGLI